MKRIEQIKKRLTEITGGGNWYFEQAHGDHGAFFANPKEHWQHPYKVFNVAEPVMPQDEKFITFAPDDIRYLLDRVEKLSIALSLYIVDEDYDSEGVACGYICNTCCERVKGDEDNLRHKPDCPLYEEE